MPFQFNFTHYEWRAFQSTLEFPEGYNESEHFLRVEFSVSRNWLVREYDDDNPAGPEGRMWMNDQELAAIDEFHDGAVLKHSDIVNGGRHEVRLFMGRANGSHVLNSYCLKAYHRETETFYQRLRFLIDIIGQLPSDCEQLPQLLTVIDSAVRMLDIRDTNRPIELADIRQFDPENKAFYASVGPALKKLKEGLAAMTNHTDNDPAIAIVGYSHIDTMWLWPFNITRFKTANTASTMLHLMENPPCDFEGDKAVPWIFLATAPQHYKWMQQDSKALWDRILQKAKEGRWEINGVMWLEPDTTIPSGESLVRQMLYGVKYFREEMGPEFKQTVLFLPDCFGFNAALPQILKLANVTGFITSKISWSEYTAFPHSTFQWRGIDGSIIPTHFITTPSSWGSAATYTGTSTAFELIGTFTKNKENNIIRESALHTAGNGDGGGGITEQMVWNFHLFNELPKINGVPRPLFMNTTEVFDEILEKLEFLPVWDDELYLEYHRGTLTSFEEIKRQNRMLEGHLHNVEWLMTIYKALAKADVSKYQKIAQEIWEFTCLCHFHDTIPGSSINEANVQAITWGRPNLTALRDMEQELSELIAKNIIAKTNKEIIFNTLAHDRYVCEQLVPSGGWALKDDETIIETDEVVTHQYMRTFNNSYEKHDLYEPFIKGQLPAYESVDVVIDSAKKTVTTPFFTVTFDDEMNFKSVVDRKTDIEYLSGPGNAFEFYEDRSIQYPAWDIQRYHKEMQLPGPTLSRIEFGEGSVTTVHTIPPIGEEKGGETTITQTITFSADAPFIDCRTVVNWTQHNKLLKVAFPTTVRARTARYGIQFGHIERPTHVNTDRDMAKFEVAGRWADLSDSSSGVSLCSNVKAGFDVHDGVVRMSLLKAPLQTDKWADYGVRKFDYRVVFHDGGFGNSNIVALSDELNVPVATTEYVQPSTPISDDALPATAEFVVVDNAKVVVETLKPAFDVDGFVVRVYEASGGWQKATVRFPLLDNSKWEVIPVDLLEKPIEAKVKQNGTPQLSFDIELNAFELESVLLKRK